jgi:hypothetical protein
MDVGAADHGSRHCDGELSLFERDDMTTSSRESSQSPCLSLLACSVTTPSLPDHLNLPRTHPAPLITSISDRASPVVVTIALAQAATPLTGRTR